MRLRLNGAFYDAGFMRTANERQAGSDLALGEGLALSPERRIWGYISGKIRASRLNGAAGRENPRITLTLCLDYAYIRPHGSGF